MTDQEAFDGVLSHLRKQKVASHVDGYCKYRHPNGNMCAIGALIPEDIYSPDIEEKDILTILNTSLLWANKYKVFFSGVNKYLLSDLQSAHDFHLIEEGMKSWEHRMQKIANKYSLEYTPVQ